MKLIVSWIILFSVCVSFAQINVHSVKYISNDFVYLDAGTVQGISIGDSVQVFHEQKLVAVLNVTYTAGHSSSCKIIRQVADIQVGDKAVHKVSTAPKQEKDIAVSNPQSEQGQEKHETSERKPTLISGSASIQAFWFQDASKQKYEYFQPSARLRIKAIQLFGIKEMGFRINYRTRYDKRSRQVNINVSRQEWRNRLSEAAIFYSNPEAAFNFRLGRIVSNKLSGIGFIVGLIVQHNWNRNWQVGLFAGSEPEWQYYQNQTSLQKYGAYLNFSLGSFNKNRMEISLSTAGIYHGSTISREFLYLRSTVIHGTAWRFYQSLELDINRDWRKDKTGETISLSGLYLNANYSFSSEISLGLSYDSRKNYYIYTYRSIADNLFDDATRQGLRGNVQFRFAKDYRLFITIGARKRDNASNSAFNYSARFTKNRFIFNRTSITTRFSGFDNQYTNGINPSLKINHNFRNNYALNVAYGAYLYQMKYDDTSRKDQWLRFGARANIFKQFFISTAYQYNFGDDFDGQRIYSELGYRF